MYLQRNGSKKNYSIIFNSIKDNLKLDRSYKFPPKILLYIMEPILPKKCKFVHLQNYKIELLLGDILRRDT